MDLQDLRRSLVGNAYVGQGQSNPNAGVYANVGLWNPVGSGVTLILRKVTIVSGANDYVFFGPMSGRLSSHAAGPTNSKNFSIATAPQGAIDLDTGATGPQYSQLAKQLLSVNCNATVGAMVPFSEPIVLPPGTGAEVCAESAAQAMNVTFEWEEV